MVEKPFTLHTSDADKVLAAANQNNKQVFIVVQNRFSPPSKWLKNAVEQNLLGRIFMVQISCYWNRDSRYYKKDSWHGTTQLDGGTLFTQFSHFIDLLYWIFGDITNIKMRAQNFNHADTTAFEDSGIATFDLVKGGMGSFSFSTCAYDKNMESRIVVIGEKGTVKISGQYMNELQYCHIENVEVPNLPPSKKPNDYGGYTGSASNHELVIDNIINTLNGNETILANTDDARKMVDIIERMYAASK